MHKSALKSLRLMLLLPLLLLGACASKSTYSPVDPPSVPPLPMEARQTPTSYCSPSCSAKLTKLREEWQQRLIEAE